MVCNKDIDRDLQIEIVEAEIKCFTQKQEARLNDHIKFESIQLLDHEHQLREVKRRKSQHLM